MNAIWAPPNRNFLHLIQKTKITLQPKVNCYLRLPRCLLPFAPVIYTISYPNSFYLNLRTCPAPSVFSILINLCFKS